MRSRLPALVLLALLLAFGWARAETVQLTGTQNQRRQAAIPLFSAPNSGASVSWWCYPGVQGEILDQGSGFLKLRIGDLTGWVQASAAVVVGAQEDAGGAAGEIVCHGNQRYRSLLQEPLEAAAVKASLGSLFPVWVMNVSADGDWLQVMVSDTLHGFLPACAVRWGRDRVRTSAMDEKVYLRKEAQRQGASRGVYFSGVPVELLFSGPCDGAWQRVPVLDVTGWMATDYLAGETRTGSCLPPVAEVATADGRTLNLRSAASYSGGILQTCRSGEKVEVLGVLGQWAHVRLRSGISGYMHMDFLLGSLDTAVRAEAVVRSNTLMDTIDGEAEFDLPAGTAVTMTQDRPWLEWSWSGTEWALREPDEITVGYEGCYGTVPLADLDTGW